jgi:hypothetical protein
MYVSKSFLDCTWAAPSSAIKKDVSDYIEDTTRDLDTERKRSDIKKEEVLSLLRSVTGKNNGLDGGTIGNGLIGIDALVGLLAVEEVGMSLTIRGIRVEPPTRIILWTLPLSTLEFQRTFSTDLRVLRCMRHGTGSSTTHCLARM